MSDDDAERPEAEAEPDPPMEEPEDDEATDEADGSPEGVSVLDQKSGGGGSKHGAKK